MKNAGLNLSRRKFIVGSAAAVAGSQLVACEECAKDPECVRAVISVSIALIKLSFAVAEEIIGTVEWGNDDVARKIEAVLKLVDVSTGVIVQELSVIYNIDGNTTTESALRGLFAENEGQHRVDIDYLAATHEGDEFEVT